MTMSAALVAYVTAIQEGDEMAELEFQAYAQMRAAHFTQ